MTSSESPRNVPLTEEEFDSWKAFLECEHAWKDEPPTSTFFKICTKCGGAEGIRFPKGFLNAV